MSKSSIAPNRVPTEEGLLSDPHLLADKTLIIFDWDGTLMDSIGLIVESMHVAGDAHGFQTTDKEVQDIIGLSLMKGIEILYPQANDAQKLAIQQSYAEYYIPNSHRTPFFTPIEDMLQSLRHQGKSLAVATGKKEKGWIEYWMPLTAIIILS